MLRLITAAGVCLMLGCSNTYENKVNKAVPTAAAPAHGTTGGYALHVKGMGCPLCATNVRKSIERTPGVESVNIDLGAGVVKVSAKAAAAPSETDLRKAVMDAGFQLDRIELSAMSFAKQAFLITTILAMPSFAQEAIFTRSATQPAAGVLAWRQQVHYMNYTQGMNEYSERTLLSYGLTGNLAIEGQLPLIMMTGSHDEFGPGDLTLLAKTRVWQRHDSAIDTARLGLFGGADFGIGPKDLTGGGVDPVFGAVYMQVAGRHGFNLDAMYQLTTAGSLNPMMPGAGKADLFRADAAYLWRFAPEEYTTEEDEAWYLTAEANLYYETNGDRELLLSPGLLFEGTECAIEVGVQLPVARCVTHRPAQGFGLTLGFRLLF